MKLERKIGDYATVAVADPARARRGRQDRQAGMALTAVNTRTPEHRGRAAAGRRDAIATSCSRRRPQAAPPPTRGQRRGTAEWKRDVVACTPGGPRHRCRRPRRRRHHGRSTSPSTAPAHADVEPRSSSSTSSAAIGLTGTHIGCDTTSCGRCTVLVDGRR